MRRASILSALALAASTLANADCEAAIVWEIASGGNGHAYELIEETRTWLDAKLAAEARIAPAGFGQGHLVTLGSQEEQNFVNDTFEAAITAIVGFPSGDGAWIGFTDMLVEGEWRWIDGTPGIWQDPDNFATPIQTAYEHWVIHGPNNTPPGEDFGVIRGNSDWNDYFNSSSLPLYIVEFEPVAAVPEPSTFTLRSVLGLIGVGWRRTRKSSRPVWSWF